MERQELPEKASRLGVDFGWRTPTSALIRAIQKKRGDTPLLWHGRTLYLPELTLPLASGLCEADRPLATMSRERLLHGYQSRRT